MSGAGSPGQGGFAGVGGGGRGSIRACDLLEFFSAAKGHCPPQPPLESTKDLYVANIKSQIKRNRQNEKRRVRNKSVRAELRTRAKNAVAAAEADAGSENSVEQLRLAVKRFDKAAARGVIHKNTAANHKSRLVRRIAAIEAAASE